MEPPSQPTSAALLERANTDIAQLLRRFENLIEYNPDSTPSLNATAVNTFQLQVESSALVRAAEDILSLTRILKEYWLFGKLDTVGATGEAEKRAEEAAKRVEEKLGRLGPLLLPSNTLPEPEAP
ncbi:MAG: hypothetical protein Q9190_002102 [Brigantiaea leucoxantha]